jgi:hypothetical protein
MKRVLQLMGLFGAGLTVLLWSFTHPESPIVIACQANVATMAHNHIDTMDIKTIAVNYLPREGGYLEQRNYLMASGFVCDKASLINKSIPLKCIYEQHLHWYSIMDVVVIIKQTETNRPESITAYMRTTFL